MLYNVYGDARITHPTSSAIFVSVSQLARRGHRVFQRGRGPGRTGISEARPFSFSNSFQLHSSLRALKPSVLPSLGENRRRSSFYVRRSGSNRQRLCLCEPPWTCWRSRDSHAHVPDIGRERATNPWFDRKSPKYSAACKPAGLLSRWFLQTISVSFCLTNRGATLPPGSIGLCRPGRRDRDRIPSWLGSRDCLCETETCAARGRRDLLPTQASANRWQGNNELSVDSLRSTPSPSAPTWADVLDNFFRRKIRCLHRPGTASW